MSDSIMTTDSMSFAEKETLCLAQAVFSYEPQADEELELIEGAIVRVFDRNDAGWWLGADIDGRTGWAPSNFLRELSADEMAMLAQAAPGHSRGGSGGGGGGGGGGLTTEAVYGDRDSVADLEPELAGMHMTIEEVSVSVDAFASSVPVRHQAQPTELAAAVVHEHMADFEEDDEQYIEEVVAETAAAAKLCAQCNTEIGSGNFVMAADKQFHHECFKCPVCHISLAGALFVEKDGHVYCEKDFHELFSPRCAKCSKAITGKYLNALGQTWHEEHFTCVVCHQPFGDGAVEAKFRRGTDDQPYCEQHFAERFGVQCHGCSKPVVGAVYEAMGRSFHIDCFRCGHDSNHLIGETDDFHQHNDKIYCTEHFQQLFLETCKTCAKVIVGQFVKVLDESYHVDCFRCSSCSTALLSGKFNSFGAHLYCSSCHVGKLAQAKGSLLGHAAPLPDASAAAAAKAASASATGKAAASTAVTKATKATSTKAAALDCDAAGSRKGSSNTVLYPVEQLQDSSNLPPGVVASEREKYLADEDFARLFQMSRAEFAALKLWKRQQLKRAHKLF